MEKIYIGFVQGVHGLRGDLKIKNRFESPEKVFIQGNHILLNDEEHTITNTKFYKGHYLVTIDNMKDINLVEKYIGSEVYFKREDLNEKEDDYIIDDLFGLKVVCGEKEYGFVKDILDNGKHKILVIDYEKPYMIPLVDEYIERVDVKKGIVYAKDVEALIL